MSGFTTAGQIAAAVGGAMHGADVELTGVFHDTRAAIDGGLYVALRGASADGHDYCSAAMASGAAAVLVEDSAGLPDALTVITVPCTRTALMDLARWWRRTALADVACVAITGTAGKTTTKDLLLSIARAAGPAWGAPRSFNNDVGVPMTVLGCRPTHRYLIAEIGTNAPGEIAPLADLVQPQISIITRIGQGHLEGLGTVEAVRAEKYELARATTDLVLLGDNCAPPPDTAAQCQTYGTDEGCDHHIDAITPLRIDGAPWPAVLDGRHGAMNITAAVVAATSLGIGQKHITLGLQQAEVSAGRFDVQCLGPLTVIDDSWNSNPDSLAASLETAAARAGDQALHLVLGSMMELGDDEVAAHEAMGAWAKAHGPASVVLIGAETRPALTHLPDALHVDDFDDTTMASIIARGRPWRGVVLVKGSRSLRLERFVACLRAESEDAEHVRTMTSQRGH